ncbi:putative reverse transcriptase domain-containing protein [Tanacetum coccineum]
MFPEEADKIERYVGGLPDMIHGNIVASKPKTMQEAIEMATELMDKRVSTMAERQAENKRKSENTSRSNLITTTTKQEAKHRQGIHCWIRGTGNANNNNQKGTGSGQKPTCFECGVQGHFQKDCPRLKNNKGNRGNQAGNNRAPAKKYMEKGYLLICTITTKRLRQVGEKRLEDVPTVQDFPEVFPEDWRCANLTRTRIRKCFIDELFLDLFQDQARARKASEDNIGIVEERGVYAQSHNRDSSILSLAGILSKILSNGFSKIAKPMTEAPPRRNKFEWGDKQEAAFQLAEAKVVQVPNPCIT